MATGTDARNCYVRACAGTDLIGNVLASVWQCHDVEVLWITQLCVHPEHRQRHVATRLIRILRETIDQGRGTVVVGILSSQPAAVAAALRACDLHIEEIKLEFVKQHARSILQSAPVKYIREAELHGALFDDASIGESISCAFTNFWVEHREPETALGTMRDKGIQWPLGSLPGGHEYLSIVRS